MIMNESSLDDDGPSAAKKPKASSSKSLQKQRERILRKYSPLKRGSRKNRLVKILPMKEAGKVAVEAEGEAGAANVEDGYVQKENATQVRKWGTSISAASRLGYLTSRSRSWTTP